jgi:hypothetical protein
VEVLTARSGWTQTSQPPDALTGSWWARTSK